MTGLALILFGTGFTGRAAAAGTTPRDPLAAADSAAKQLASDPDFAMTLPQAMGSESTDSLAREYRLEAVRSYYQGVAFGNRHRAEVFRWQHLSTRVIFFMVHVLVLAGLYFSWMQFRDDLVRRRRADARARDAKAAAPAADDKTTLKASLQGVEVSSSILGVIILVVSLLFFYLYLVHVYPIVVVR